MIIDSTEANLAMPLEITPSIAVVIPCYNGEKWVGRAIKSVLSEKIDDLLLVVVDDGSTDRSSEKISMYRDHITQISSENFGACHARNNGMELAKSNGAEYVLFLDADDYVEGGMIRHASALAKKMKADLVLSNMHVETSETREERLLYKGSVPPETLFSGWMRGDYVNPSAILWRIKFIDQIGGWDESLARAQDLEITLRAMFHAPRIWKNDQGAAIHARVNEFSISQDNSRKATESRLRAVLSILDRTPGTTLEPLAPLLYDEIYSIARAAFRGKQTDLGRIALARLRQEGFNGHPGTYPHRLVSMLLGLENKVRLWGR